MFKPGEIVKYNTKPELATKKLTPIAIAMNGQECRILAIEPRNTSPMILSAYKRRIKRYRINLYFIQFFNGKELGMVPEFCLERPVSDMLVPGSWEVIKNSTGWSPIGEKEMEKSHEPQ